MDRYLVISSDCHAGPPPEVFRDYLDPQYRPAYDEVLEEQQKRERVYINQKRFGVKSNKAYVDNFMENERVKEGGRSGAWDPAVRARELDRDGVAAEVIFPVPQEPGGNPPFGGGFMIDRPLAGAHPVELQYAGARAYNRWLAEMCAVNPERHAGGILVPMDDIEESVTEIKRARESGLFGGLVLPPLAPLPVEEGVAQDAEQPSPVGRLVGRYAPRRERLERTFLDQVAGLVAVVGQAEPVAEQAAQIAFQAVASRVAHGSLPPWFAPRIGRTALRRK